MPLTCQNPGKNQISGVLRNLSRRGDNKKKPGSHTFYDPGHFSAFSVP